MRSAILVLLVLSAASGAAAQTAASQPTDPLTDEDLTIQAFLQAVETTISTTNRAAWLELLSPNADRDAATEFFDSMIPRGVTRVVVRERDRAPLIGSLPGEGYLLVVEVFVETGARARIMTWRLDIRRPRETTERQPWRLVDEERLSTVEGLHRLSLHPEKQFVARDLVIGSVDFELRLPAGEVFVAETAEGVTALVLVGDGMMSFTPEPSEERGQVRIFAGSDAIETAFTIAFVRLNPYEFDQLLKRQTLTATPLDPRVFRRAQTVFEDEVAKSFSLDLSYLSRDVWSLLPQAGDFLAEVRTRRFDTLTYARSTGEPEDVSLFHRQRKKNISAYASPMKLSSRGRFYNEDDLVEYDVLDYNIHATFQPDREWLDGRARLKLRIKAYALGALTLKLSEDFNVKSITSEELGRLLFLRVRYQNSIVVNLPSPVSRDVELTLDIAYSGPIRSQSIDQESIAVQGRGQRSEEAMYVPAEPKWLFSNRSHWYPQGQVTDYATATIQVTLPGQYMAVATGMLLAGAPTPLNQDAGASRMTYVFSARQPVRYLGVVVSRMNRVDAATVALDVIPAPAPRVEETPERPAPTGRTRAAARTSSEPVTPIGGRNTIALAVEANRRQEARGRDLTMTAAEVLRLYSSLLGDAPYEAMTIAMVEDSVPGGHSPGYFAVIHNALPMSPYTWRNDPASFQNFPEFYLAHELAHQWFGQAVGWKNYHEQWLSEGFAQYLAALFAKEKRGEGAFRDVLRQFRRWALGESDQGAVYLGYRLGHLKSDTRIFRALVYNKGAGVLHMLRRLVGDDAFFRGVRRFYAENRFKKAGTADLQRGMEGEAGRSLDRFFQRWIYESAIPRFRYSATVEGQEVVVRFDLLRASAEGPLYDVPVTVAINAGDKTLEDVVIISDATAEKRFPLTGTLRGVDVNADGAALAVFERR